MSAVTVYTDYVCPFRLLAEQVLTDIGERFLRGTPPLNDLRQAMDQFGRIGHPRTSRALGTRCHKPNQQ